MSEYVNGMSINLNEIAHIEFTTQIRDTIIPTVKVSMLYDVLKQMHKTMGEAIEQHDAKLHELQRTKQNMN